MCVTQIIYKTKYTRIIMLYSDLTKSFSISSDGEKIKDKQTCLLLPFILSTFHKTQLIQEIMQNLYQTIQYIHSFMEYFHQYLCFIKKNGILKNKDFFLFLYPHMLGNFFEIQLHVHYWTFWTFFFFNVYRQDHMHDN